jgi:hypothetical protein
MANRNFSRVQGLNKELKLLAGRLEDDDTSNAGLGWSGANTGTGTYTITLEDKYNALISMTATIQSTSGTDDFIVSVVSHDVSSAKTIDLEVAVAGTLTDLGDTDEIHWLAVLQNSATPSV